MKNIRLHEQIGVMEFDVMAVWLGIGFEGFCDENSLIEWIMGFDGF